NALWLEKEYSFLPGFLNTAKNNFSAHLSRVDFKKKHQEATVQINQWVEKATTGRIKNLISPGAVDSLTRMVLTNAIYFKEEWHNAFDTSRTYNAPFYLDDNTQIYVPMMFRQESFRYYAEKSFQMIELPYSQSDLSMMVLLPDKDLDFSVFETSLNACFFKENIKNLKKQKIQLSLPKFSFSTPYTMSGILKKMGMTDAFTRRADFSRIDGTRNLYISEIFHKAFIQVNEKGTQASAGSGAVMGLGGISSNPLFIADHPFIFFIFDRFSNTILFMGRVTNPT
ncbi:MAG: serpin family protein, partial [Desulfobacteraceae bacterium]|nr:serpin family protein [Desulfobacteraceae bacterium]